MTGKSTRTVRLCESMRMERDMVLAEYEAQGIRKQDYNQIYRDILSWFDKVPDLSTEMQLLAWKHRGESPFIRLSSTS